jgi:pimeloyl-ACP methyl ester carboxylesterase
VVDDGGRVAISVLKRAAWWVADYVYAGFWQLRAAMGRRDASAYATGELTPIVVLPGVYETWRFMEPQIAAMHARGHPVHVVEALRRNQYPIGDLATTVTDFLGAHDLGDVILVAHSKGGLAGKLVLLGAESSRVRGLLAIATPFGGSRYARRMPGRVLRSFAPDDPSIVRLAHELAVNARIVSIYAAFDPHIPEGSELAGAKNVRLDMGGHFRVLAHPRVLGELAVLSED